MILAFGCAQQVGPAGGPKDKNPPKITESEPLNFSTGFSENKIKLRFDEFVQLKDFQNKLIISPPLKKLPEFRIKGKWLELTFDDTLLSNTTYNFQFGDGIADITEGNPLDSNIFVFSTGNKIDSLFVQGKVKNAFNLSPEKNVLVMLYNDFSDSLPILEKPIYFSKTKEDGTFKIQYVKEGKYKIFDLKDGNGNYLFDLPDEQIGFREIPVIAGDTAENELLLFQQDVSKQFLKRAYAEHFGKLVFAFAKPAEKVKIIPLNYSFKKSWFIEELSANKDTLIYWLTGAESLDTLKAQVSEDLQILDTVEIIIPKKDTKEKTRGRGSFPEKLSLSSNANSSQPFDLFSALKIESVNPVKSYDAQKIILVEKNDTVKINIESPDKAMRKFEISHKWKEATEYKILIPPATFFDIYDLQNDTFRLNFKTRKKDDYGNINVKFKIENSERQYIIQLMDGNEKVLQEKFAYGTTTLKFENILVGKYKMKLIYDSSKNSKWDTGNYMKKIQPEKIIYYASPLDLRPKFDLDLEWKIMLDP